jgi:hypothetical protein
MDKFAELRKKDTNEANYELDTEDVIERLQKWDAAYGVELSDVGHDRVAVKFKKLPADVGALAAEAYEFCPDVIDQHFGCFAEMIEAMEEMGEEAPEGLSDLVEGVDLEDENYGLELLKRSLEQTKAVALWWD